MARLGQVKLTLVVWISLFLFGGVGGAAQAASGDPITVIPADSLFCVRINNLTGTMGKIDQFLTGVSPIGVSMIVPAQLAKLLGSAEPKGISMAGDFAVFGPLPGGDVPSPTRVAVLVPVSDYKQFSEGNPNVMPPDAEGISAIGPKEQPMFVATSVTGYALVTTPKNRQALIEVKKLLSGPGATALAKRLGPEELKRAQGSPIWAYANIQTVSKMFGPKIQAMLQEAKKGMEQAKKEGQPMPGQTDAVMDMYAGMVNSLMQETQFLSLTLDPSANAIRVGVVAAAMPNTEMAKVFQGNSAVPDRKFMQYLENGAVMNLVMSMDPAAWNRINNFYLDLFAKLAGKDPSSEEVRSYKKLMTEATGALTGTLAASFSADPTTKPPFRLQEVVGVKDPQAFNRAMDQMPAMFESGLMADLMKELGWKFKFELKRKVETYKDVPIDSVKVSMEATDPNSPESKMIASIYGEGIDSRIAVVNNLLVCAAAKDPGTLVRKLIDQAKGGGTQAVPSEVQAAMELIPGSEKASLFATYNYLRLLGIAASIMPLPIPLTPVQSQSNIAVAGKAAGGSLNIEMAVPKQHLMEIMGVFMQLQQQQQQQKMREQPPQDQSQVQPQTPSQT